MRNRKLVTLTLSATALSGAVLAAPAATADTNVMVTLSGNDNGLSITQPSADATLAGNVSTGSVITGSLGETTVTDNRGSLLGWSVSAKTDGDLVSTAAGSTDKIALSATGPLALATGAVTAGSPLSLLSGVSVGAGGFLNPTTSVPVATSVAGAGGGTYKYNPTLTLTVPGNTKAGEYKTVVTQTFS